MTHERIVPTTCGYGDTPEEKGQEALDKNFVLRQGRAEAIQDYVNREEILSMTPQESTNITLDGKMRGCWLLRTSALTEQDISGIRIISLDSTDLPVVRRAILQTIVQRNREGIPDARRERKDRARDKTDSSNDNFHTLSDDDDTASESEDSCEDEQALE